MNIRQGLLKAFDSINYKADVQMTGSLPAFIAGVAVSRDIASSDLVTDRKVAIIFFDEGNPNDAVLTAVWT